MTMMIAKTAFSDAAKAQLAEVERRVKERFDANREDPTAVVKDYLVRVARIYVGELIVKPLIAGLANSKIPFWAKKWRGQR